MPVEPSYVKFAKGTPSARFLKFCKVGSRSNSCKKKARKNTLARTPSCPNLYFLKVPTQHNILLQTAPLKLPVEPSYVKFAKGTSSARFLKFCKVWSRSNSCKKKARKNTLARMSSCPNLHFLEVPTQHNILLQTALLKVPVEPSYVKFVKGTPSALFLKFCKVKSRSNSCKKKAKKNTLARMPSCPNQHFLKVPTQHNILLQIAPLKVPVEPSYVKLSKGTPSARFLKFCKVGSRSNSCKKKARKNTLARMPSCPNYNFSKVPTQHNILLQTAPLKVPVEPSYVKFAKGTPSARFLKFCKVGSRSNSCKKKVRKNILARMPSCRN